MTTGLDQAAIAEANAVRTGMGGGQEIKHSTPVYLLNKNGQAEVELNQTMDPADLSYDIKTMLKQ